MNEETSSLNLTKGTRKLVRGWGDTHPIHPKMWANDRNPERCHLYVYKEYERHRPYDMREPYSPFYLVLILRGLVPETTHGQKNSLGMMKVTAEKAGIKEKFTNHSTRRTSIGQLMAH